MAKDYSEAYKKKSWNHLTLIPEESREKLLKEYQLNEKIALKFLKSKYNKKSQYEIFCCKAKDCEFQIKFTKKLPKQNINDKNEEIEERKSENNKKEKANCTLMVEVSGSHNHLKTFEDQEGINNYKRIFF